MKKIWLCYGAFGGGHLSPAKALGEALERQYPGQFAIQYINVAEFLPAQSRHFFESWYTHVIGGMRLSFTLAYALNKLSWVCALQNFAAFLIARSNMREAIIAEKPDAIVTFFYFTGAIAKIISGVPNPPEMYVCATDPFTTIGLWFSKNPLPKYVVASDQVKNYAISKHIEPNKISVLPFFVRESFDLVKLKNVTRTEGGKFQVLVGGGGVGMKKLSKSLKALESLPSNISLHVVCGKNPKLVNEIRAYAAKHRERLITVYGFVDNFAELMNKMDLLIGKAGASFTFEALALCKPVILIDYIWGQELGNMQYVVDNKFGWYEPDLTKVAPLVTKILSDQTELARHCQRLREHQFKSGAPLMAESLAKDLVVIK